jgi:hypothetical protein
MYTTLILSKNEQEALTVLLNALTYDDVEMVINRSLGSQNSDEDIAYKIWNVTDDLHRTLLDRNSSKEIQDA